MKPSLVNRPRFDLYNNLLTDILTIDEEFQYFSQLLHLKFLELIQKRNELHHFFVVVTGSLFCSKRRNISVITVTVIALDDIAIK